MIVRKIFLREPSPTLRTGYLDAAEWDGAVLRVGQLVIPMSNVKEFQIEPPPPPAPEPTPVVRKSKK